MLLVAMIKVRNAMFSFNYGSTASTCQSCRRIYIDCLWTRVCKCFGYQ